MQYLNKMISAVVWSYSRETKENFVFNVAYFGSKFISSVPISILIFQLVNIFIEVPLIDSKTGNFIAIMIIYPVVDYFTLKKDGIKKIIETTNEENLEKYLNHYRILFGVSIVAMLFLFIMLNKIR